MYISFVFFLSVHKRVTKLKQMYIVILFQYQAFQNVDERCHIFIYSFIFLYLVPRKVNRLRNMSSFVHFSSTSTKVCSFFFLPHVDRRKSKRKLKEKESSTHESTIARLSFQSCAFYSLRRKSRRARVW